MSVKYIGVMKYEIACCGTLDPHQVERGKPIPEDLLECNECLIASLELGIVRKECFGMIESPEKKQTH